MEADEPGAVARNEALRASKYLDRAIWRRWSGYHRRSRVESKMNCIKLLGQSLMARDFERQVTAGPYRRAEWLHRAWHTSHGDLRVNPSGERGTALKSRFLQQHRISAETKI